jgi:hypothetical protein
MHMYSMVIVLGNLIAKEILSRAGVPNWVSFWKVLPPQYRYRVSVGVAHFSRRVDLDLESASTTNVNKISESSLIVEKISRDRTALHASTDFTVLRNFFLFLFVS